MISTGARSITAPICADQGGERLRAAGREPISSARGSATANGRSVNGRRLGCRRSSGAGSSGAAWRERRAAAPARTERPRAAEIADLLDQFAAERGDGRRPRDAGGLGDVVGGAERQRPQADLGVAARQRRGHDDDEVALLLQQQRQRRDAVELRHVDVEHDDVGIGALELSTASRPVRSDADDRHVRLGVDPARQQAAHDHRVVDDHDADRLVGGGRGARGGKGGTHDTWTLIAYANFSTGP